MRVIKKAGAPSKPTMPRPSSGARSAGAGGPQPRGLPRHHGKTAPAGKYWCGHCKAYRAFKNIHKVSDGGEVRTVGNCAKCNSKHTFRLPLA